MAGNAESVLLAIESAFPKGPCPGAVETSLNREDQSPEGHDASRLLIGKAWYEIDCRDFECNYPSPFVIDNIAMQYYFPGLLRCAVCNPDSNLASALIPFRLLPPKRELKFSEFAFRYAWMTQEQKGAVVHFLSFFRDSTNRENERLRRQVHFLSFFRDSTNRENERLRRQIDDAIHRFWGIPM